MCEAETLQDRSLLYDKMIYTLWRPLRPSEYMCLQYHAAGSLVTLFWQLTIPSYKPYLLCLSQCQSRPGCQKPEQIMCIVQLSAHLPEAMTLSTGSLDMRKNEEPGHYNHLLHAAVSHSLNVLFVAGVEARMYECAILN